VTKPTALTIACLTLSFSILPVIAADTQPANDDPALTEAEEICRALAKNSDDKVLLKKLNSVMLKVKDDEQRARFVASFGLGALLVGASKEAAAARDYLDKNHPTSPYRQKLSADSLNDKCTKCNGTGVQKTNCRACNGSGKCPTCHGRGYVQVQKIGGGTRRGKCACGGSGKCKACGGTGKVSRTCTACRGKGTAFSREKARAVYIALLREKEIAEERVVQQAAERKRQEELARQRVLDEQRRAEEERRLAAAQAEAARKRLEARPEVVQGDGKNKQPQVPDSIKLGKVTRLHDGYRVECAFLKGWYCRVRGKLKVEVFSWDMHNNVDYSEPDTYDLGTLVARAECNIAPPDFHSSTLADKISIKLVSDVPPVATYLSARFTFTPSGGGQEIVGGSAYQTLMR